MNTTVKEICLAIFALPILAESKSGSYNIHYVLINAYAVVMEIYTFYIVTGCLLSRCP